MDIGGLLTQTTQRLAQALALEPREARLEARVLAGRALGVTPAWLIGHDRDTPSPAQSAAMETLVARRAAGEPVAYILGEREFFGRRFRVSPDVLIPRPDTELLVEAALRHLPGADPRRVLDLGTGSGCLAVTLALERPAWEVTALDRSPAAVEIARGNAADLGARVAFIVSDWFAEVPGQRFNLIVANPPYVAAGDSRSAHAGLAWEPAGALFAGNDGLDDIRRIAVEAPVHLESGGWLLLEHGWDQANAVRDLLRDAGFEDIGTLHDLAGLPRVGSSRWR